MTVGIMIKAGVVLTCGLIFCSNAFSEVKTDAWLYIFSSSEGDAKEDYFMKSSTFRHKGDQSSLLIKRIIRKPSDNSTLERYYKAEISDETCEVGYGKLVIKDMEGTLYANPDYAAGAKSNSAFVGDMMCTFRRNIQ